MKQNLGTTDRIVRVFVGVGLIAYGIGYHHWIGALGAVPLLTAVIGFCPAYCPLGLRTTGSGSGGGGCGGGKCD